MYYFRASRQNSRGGDRLDLKSLFGLSHMPVGFSLAWLSLVSATLFLPISSLLDFACVSFGFVSLALLLHTALGSSLDFSFWPYVVAP
jgi:hypothetical protein